MRLHFVNDRFDPNRSEGTKAHIEGLTKHLVKLGWEIWSPPESVNAHSKKLSNRLLHRYTQISRMDAYYVRLCAGDIPRPSYLRWPVTWIWDKPLIWEVNATLQYSSQSELSWPIEKVLMVERNQKRKASSVDLAICNTVGLANYASDLGVRNVIVVPLGADPEIYHPDVVPLFKNDTSIVILRVLWCGTDNYWWHDLDTLLEAARRLSHRQDIMFYVVGDTDKVNKFPKNVMNLGRLPSEKMPNLFSSMDVGLSLYRESSIKFHRRPESPRETGSPIKVFEYLSSGLIIVASPLTQLVDEVIQPGKNGFLLDFGDVDHLVSILLDIAENKYDNLSIKKAASETVLNYYNWQRVALQTSDAIKKLF